MNLKVVKRFMKNFKKIDKKKAKALYNKALFKTFFHNPEWQDFLEKEFKWLKFEHYLYRDKVLLTFGRVGNKLISLPFCEYGGPLGDFKERDILKEFKNIKVRVHPKIKKGDSDVSTYWLNLKGRSEKDLLACFRKTLRHSIRNAQEQDLEIKKCSNEQELRRFYNLYVANLKRKKTVPYPYSIFKYLYNQPEAEILLALYKNKIIAGNLFLYYSGFVHYFLSASDYKYRKLGANYLLLWEKIKSLVGKTRPDGRGFVFDFGAASKGSALETFKKGWRGKEYPILQIGIKRSEESLRSSGLRNIWGLLPNFVIKKLSPYLIKYRL